MHTLPVLDNRTRAYNEAGMRALLYKTIKETGERIFMGEAEVAPNATWIEFQQPSPTSYLDARQVMIRPVRTVRYVRLRTEWQDPDMPALFITQ